MLAISPITSAIYRALPEGDASFTLAERPERIHGVWSPLERLLDRIEATGDIDAARGRPVFSEAGAWYEVAPAVAGIVEFHELANRRHGIRADTSALVKLARKLDHGTPLFDADLNAARACIAACKRQAARLTVAQAVSIVRTVQIGIEMERPARTSLQREAAAAQRMT